MPRKRSETSAQSENATSRKLEKAALALLKKNGILGGLKLTDVADFAKVNRRLVYHYFGSRGDLLAAALLRDSDRRFDTYVPETANWSVARWITQWAQLTFKHSELLRLAAILLLDGKTPVLLTTRQDQIQQQLRAAQQSGAVDPQVDAVAVHAFMHAWSVGYAVTRKQLAREFRVGVRDLDDRMLTLMDRLAHSLQPPNDAT